MTATTIRQKLYDYIRVAEDKKVKAIYTIFENEIEATAYNHWDDEKFVQELDRRSVDYKKNKNNASSWEDVKSEILASDKK